MARVGDGGSVRTALDDETPRPKIESRCAVCKVEQRDVEEHRVVVSPSGKAHFGSDIYPGDTSCGKDATGDGWWWRMRE